MLFSDLVCRWCGDQIVAVGIEILFGDLIGVCRGLKINGVGSDRCLCWLTKSYTFFLPQCTRVIMDALHYQKEFYEFTLVPEVRQSPSHSSLSPSLPPPSLLPPSLK